MKTRPTDIVLMVIAIAVMAYLLVGMITTWYPHKTAHEVEVQYLQQKKIAKPWP